MKQVFLPIPGYEDFYEISNLGNIKALPRLRQQCNLGGPYEAVFKGFDMKPSIDKDGYYKTALRGADGVRKFFRVHRLVAMTFIDNPHNKPQVNHKDFDKQNNSVDNLEWNTAQENQSHAYGNGHHALNKHRCPKTGQMMRLHDKRGNVVNPRKRRKLAPIDFDLDRFMTTSKKCSEVDNEGTNAWANKLANEVERMMAVS